jgi:hypothetical protein
MQASMLLTETVIMNSDQQFLNNYYVFKQDLLMLFERKCSVVMCSAESRGRNTIDQNIDTGN